MKNIIRIFIFTILLSGCFAHNHLKEPIISKLCLDEVCPSGTNKYDQIVNHKIIILANNPKTKFADWVAYKVEKKLINGPKRPRDWKQDPKLPPNTTLPPLAYKYLYKLNSDRGHQAPLASFKGSENYYVVNYLSNITPQKSDLNKNAWEKLEKKIRNYVKNNNFVYVVTGPYYDKKQKPTKALPNYKGTVIIPKGYFKVVAKKENGNIYATAFVMSQDTPPNIHYCSTISTLENIKYLTSLSIFSKTPEGNMNKDLHCANK